MKNTILTALFIVVLLIGCKDENDIPSDIITLDTLIENGLKGLYFKTGKIINYTYPDDIKPDIIVLGSINSAENIISLTNVDFIPTFAFTDSFDDKESAEIYFDNYNNVASGIYDEIAYNVKPYQVWTIKADEGKFVKLLVLNVKVWDDENNPYAEVTFRWAYLE